MFERTKLLIGDKGLDNLLNSSVLVLGVGGVGGIAAESLARSGVRKLVLVDGDIIDESNLNRQIQTQRDNIGKSKVVEMKKRLLAINPDIEIEIFEMFYDKDKNYILDNVDFVVDAIDTLSSKIDLYEYCLHNNIEFISSMGMGNRLDPSKVLVSTLAKTNYDPLAKILRKMARDRHLDLRLINVVFSSEIPIKQNTIINDNAEVRKRKMPPASMFLVPPAAGLNCASYCINYLINRSETNEL